MVGGGEPARAEAYFGNSEAESIPGSLCCISKLICPGLLLRAGLPCYAHASQANLDSSSSIGQHGLRLGHWGFLSSSTRQFLSCSPRSSLYGSLHSIADQEHHPNVLHRHKARAIPAIPGCAMAMQVQISTNVFAPALSHPTMVDAQPGELAATEALICHGFVQTFFVLLKLVRWRLFAS